MILVIDGQGGGIGRSLVELVTAACPDEEVYAAGTNYGATTAMLKAGAHAGATGENAVVYNAGRARIITGPAGILLANSMYGEITPAMACAVSQSDGHKVIIPVSKSALHIPGLIQKPLAGYLEEAVSIIKTLCIRST